MYKLEKQWCDAFDLFTGSNFTKQNLVKAVQLSENIYQHEEAKYLVDNFYGLDSDELKEKLAQMQNSDVRTMFYESILLPQNNNELLWISADKDYAPAVARCAELFWDKGRLKYDQLKKAASSGWRDALYEGFLKLKRESQRETSNMCYKAARLGRIIAMVGVGLGMSNDDPFKYIIFGYCVSKGWNSCLLRNFLDVKGFVSIQSAVILVQQGKEKMFIQFYKEKKTLYKQCDVFIAKQQKNIRRIINTTTWVLRVMGLYIKDVRKIIAELVYKEIWKLHDINSISDYLSKRIY